MPPSTLLNRPDAASLEASPVQLDGAPDTSLAPAQTVKRMTGLRRAPKLWDYCYFTARMNLAVLERVAGRRAAGTRVVDIGCGTKPFRELFHPDCEYTGVDFDGRSAADIVHDLGQSLPLEDGCANVVILSEAIEHVPDPELVLSEAARVLAPGGELFLSAPFAFPIHGRPYDFRRFTDYFYRALPGRLPLELVELEASNNVFTTPLVLVNQLLLSAPGLPWGLKRIAWFGVNLTALACERLARPWWRRDSRAGLFLRMNPSGYAMRFRRTSR
jgi:SAM-dependent methyltransferase